MISGSPIPSDPLAFIQAKVRTRQLLWTYHVNMRLGERHISRAVLLAAVDTYAIIESYTDRGYLPSYLVLAHSGDTVFHILFAADVAGDNARVLTTYRPDPSEWEANFRTRRPAQ